MYQPSRLSGRCVTLLHLLLLNPPAEGYTQVYLPFYSDMAADRRKRVRDGTLGDKGRPGGPGSMWSNIDDVAKGKR